MISPHYVTSSNIDAIGFDNNTLSILFKSGISYAYKGVTQTMFEAMKAVESVGRYFHQHIKDKFTHTKLEINPFNGSRPNPQ